MSTTNLPFLKGPLSSSDVQSSLGAHRRRGKIIPSSCGVGVSCGVCVGRCSMKYRKQTKYSHLLRQQTLLLSGISSPSSSSTHCPGHVGEVISKLKELSKFRPLSANLWTVACFRLDSSSPQSLTNFTDRFFENASTSTSFVAMLLLHIKDDTNKAMSHI